MKKIFYSIFAVSVFVLIGCGGGRSTEGETSGEAEKKDSSLVEQEQVDNGDLESYQAELKTFMDTISKLPEMSIEKFERRELIIGYNNANTDPLKYNITGLLYDGSGGADATFALAVYDNRGKYVTHAFLTLDKGVRIKLNAAQTKFTFTPVETGPESAQVSVSIDTDDKGPDVKISNRNALFHDPETNCTIIGSDDARDSAMGCREPIAGDLKGSKEYLVHFEAVDDNSGNLIFSNPTSSNLLDFATPRCSKSCLKVEAWGFGFQYDSPACLPTTCDTCP